KTNIEKLENGRVGIVITEFPYRRNKSKILQTISEMTGDKRHAKVLEGITDIRDESDRNGIRAVIEFKKSVDEDNAEKILKYLFKKTDLQCNISFNMVALSNGKPETMGLKTIIKHYVEHQKEIVTRRTKKELDTAKKRFH
ncbi:DNA gyrase subunit A, partial [Klebsiella pneumoniae]|nr:DNA gyrase subunit A [Klebsiella pneumoniae]